MSADTSQLKHLEYDLEKAPERVRSPKGLMAAGRIVAREMRVDATGHKGNYFGKPGTEYLIPTPRVSSELINDHVVEAGIEAKGVGNLFGIIAYGSTRNAPAYDPGAGPRRAMSRALDEMADHAEDSVFGRRGK